MQIFDANIAHLSESSEKIFIPEEVLLILFSKSLEHCHEIYWHIRSNKLFSGILPIHKIPLMAKILGKSKGSVERKLRQLQSVGVVEKKKTCWMLVGQDKITASAGRKRNRRMDVSGFLGNPSAIKTFGYATLISREGMKAARRQRRKEKFGKSSTGAPVAAIITARDTGRSERTIYRQRSMAKSLLIIDYKRDITIHGKVSYFDDGIEAPRQGGKTFLAKNGTMLHEGPALITRFAASKCFPIKKELYALAEMVEKSRL